jgi:hypothetical protein
LIESYRCFLTLVSRQPASWATAAMAQCLLLRPDPPLIKRATYDSHTTSPQIHETQKYITISCKNITIQSHFEATLKDQLLNNIIQYLFSRKGPPLHGINNVSFDCRVSCIASLSANFKICTKNCFSRLIASYMCKVFTCKVGTNYK